VLSRYRRSDPASRAAPAESAVRHRREIGHGSRASNSSDRGLAGHLSGDQVIAQFIDGKFPQHVSEISGIVSDPRLPAAVHCPDLKACSRNIFSDCATVEKSSYVISALLQL
jgi:hypothetical protein